MFLSVDKTLTAVYDFLSSGLRTDSTMIRYGRPWGRLNRAILARFGRLPRPVGAGGIYANKKETPPCRVYTQSFLNLFSNRWVPFRNFLFPYAGKVYIPLRETGLPISSMLAQNFRLHTHKAGQCASGYI
ncbi:hypothetical protein DESHY_50104 [Desulforamulus hydrothermalis Lam5 = DSM 18033]|uniref:Uncharacterized protein n=1 Tax=Desulforamulus hydrothermalis Lam5 = DSM 18033 TaxID=1121428 RepID=K8EJQ1_9FIRM|nr:hypothetical protein DESHY_50104 [Desulforamulus hydrothermalis Lam5 = DSM 18033]